VADVVADVADVTVQVFTFTTNEATAVTELLTRLYIDLPAFGPTVWTPTKLGEEVLEGRLSDGRTARLEHHPLSAQGNVVAAAELTRSVWGNRDKKRADYYLFYGCCGAVKSELVGQVFRVKSVSYMSLGVVDTDDDAPGGEVVKLKNKWIVHTDPDEQSPLKTIALPAGSPGVPGFVSGLGLLEAHVLATDKVVRVSPGTAPEPKVEGPTPVYQKGEWTYSQTLAQYTEIPRRAVCSRFTHTPTTSKAGSSSRKRNACAPVLPVPHWMIRCGTAATPRRLVTERHDPAEVVSGVANIFVRSSWPDCTAPKNPPSVTSASPLM
jgi:hypothetical protein